MSKKPIIQTYQKLNCAVCGKKGEPLFKDMKDILFGVSGEWSMLKCSNNKCGLAWLSPMPEERDIGKAYTNYYTHAEAKPKLLLISLRGFLERSLLREVYGYGAGTRSRLRKMTDVIISRLPWLRENVGAEISFLEYKYEGKLLDIGCGNGHYLNKMQVLGWNVSGVEPDESAGLFARNKYNIPVIVGTINDACFPNDTFDVITLNHVVEHVHILNALLSECRRVLKPGGKIVILTPNIDSLGRRLFREFWRGLEPPRHIYIYTKNSLAQCCLASDFEIENIGTISRSARGMWVASKNIRSKGKYAIDRLNWTLRVQGAIFRLIESMLNIFFKNVGEEIFIILKK